MEIIENILFFFEFAIKYYEKKQGLKSSWPKSWKFRRTKGTTQYCNEHLEVSFMKPRWVWEKYFFPFEMEQNHMDWKVPFSPVMKILPYYVRKEWVLSNIGIEMERIKRDPKKSD